MDKGDLVHKPRGTAEASLFPVQSHKYSYLENPSASPMRDAAPPPNVRPLVLIAIGGGGASHGTHPEIDAFCLRHLPPAPVLGYVGTASGDDPGKSARVRAAFAPHEMRELPMSADATAAARWAEGLDMIHVGGGDPVRLLDHLRATGIDRVLVGAARRGVVLAGVSAGAMTPHASTEPDRIAAMAAHVAAGDLPAGWAIDDGAALVMSDGAPAGVFPADGPPRVHRIARDHAGGAAAAVLTL
ncbi:MAG: Type 1 glutamine amidotransferase-like domain-containing protein [Rhodobacteraceae bacterium]|nr:Type 1 glutamine amidotransferase-like domain-containing protein [Paracoccaceae bacterium]